MPSKEEFLNRVKNNLPQAGSDHPGSFQGYTFQADAPAELLIQAFSRELEALSGYVHVLTDIEALTNTILQILNKHRAKYILAWEESGLETPWLDKALAEAGISMVRYDLAAAAADRKAQLAEIEEIIVGITGAQAGLADTGTIALVSGPGRGRLPSLLPPVHIALLSSRKLYPSLPLFLSAQATAIAQGSNLILITGPSRTADIEMTLTMGVHGPGEIHVIITP